MPTLRALAIVTLLSLAAGEAHAQVLAGAALGAGHQAAGKSESRSASTSRWGLTNHAALIGIGRLYQLEDNDRDTSGVVKRGVSSTLVRYGGGLHLRF